VVVKKTKVEGWAAYSGGDSADGEVVVVRYLRERERERAREREFFIDNLLV